MDDFVWSSWTQEGVFDEFSNFDHAFLAPMLHQFSDSDHGGSGGDGGGGDCKDGKVGSASKNHSEAEKRRRDRINAHLATLRKLVSNSNKMDKAALLGKVVEHVKELKSETMEISKVFTVPTDSDELIIDFDSTMVDPHNNLFIKASICCEDRPELFSEINHAVNSLRLTVIQADMTCLGGRIKCNFIFCVTSNTSDTEIRALKQSLKILFSRIISTSSWTTSNYRIKSKRQRFFCSSNYDTSDR